MTDKKADLLETLKTRILTLEVVPGAALDEAEIGAEFGISRTPIREVFQKLAGQGYIRLNTGRAPTASSMDFATMRQFFQSAPMVYAATTRLAAESHGAGRIGDLKAIQISFRTAARSDNPQKSALLNHKFHALIGKMAANPYLSPALDRLLIDHTRLSQVFFSPTSAREAALVDRSVSDHDEIIRAIETGDSATAVQVTLNHWALSRDSMERYVRPDPLTDPMDLIREAQR